MATSMSFAAGGQLCASNEVNTYMVQIDQNEETVGCVQRLLNIGNC